MRTKIIFIKHRQSALLFDFVHSRCRTRFSFRITNTKKAVSVLAQRNRIASAPNVVECYSAYDCVHTHTADRADTQNQGQRPHHSSLSACVQQTQAI